MLANLDKFGRIVIPKQFRDDMGLQPGDTLEVLEADGGIFLKPQSEAGQLFVREGVLLYQATTTGNLDHAVEEARTDRLNKLGISI